jgi:hypothetical protein
MGVERAQRVMRQQARERYVEMLRSGQRLRATTFSDRRKEHSRRACRGPVKDW